MFRNQTCTWGSIYIRRERGIAPRGASRAAGRARADESPPRFFDFNSARGESPQVVRRHGDSVGMILRWFLCFGDQHRGPFTSPDFSPPRRVQRRARCADVPVRAPHSPVVVCPFGAESKARTAHWRHFRRAPPPSNSLLLRDPPASGRKCMRVALQGAFVAGMWCPAFCSDGRGAACRARRRLS